MEMPAQPNQSLIDGLSCLQELAGAVQPMGALELADRLGLGHTRAHRLMKTLAGLGLLEQDERRRYRPGPGMHVLAAQAVRGSGLLRAALPELRKLHRWRCTVAMGVLWRDQVAYLYTWRPGMPADEAIGNGRLYPAAQSGLGIALLAQSSDEDAQQALLGLGDSELQAAQQRIARAQRLGYARVPSPAADHQHTVAVALPAPTKAAIGLLGAFDEPISDEVLDQLHQATQAISRRL